MQLAEAFFEQLCSIRPTGRYDFFIDFARLEAVQANAAAGRRDDDVAAGLEEFGDELVFARPILADQRARPQ